MADCGRGCDTANEADWKSTRRGAKKALGKHIKGSGQRLAELEDRSQVRQMATRQEGQALSGPDTEETPPVAIGTDAPPRDRPRRRSVGWVLLRALTFVLPWTLAIIGWLIASSLLLYSHGLSDRVRTTRSVYQRQIADLNTEIAQSQALRGYLLIPGVEIEPLKNWVSATSSTRVQLVRAPGYAHGIVIAHHLAPPPSGDVYVVWAETQDHVYQSLGTFVTSSPDGDALLVVAADQPINQLLEMGISVEPSPKQAAPTTALLFTAVLSTPTPLPTRTPTATATKPPLPTRTEGRSTAARATVVHHAGTTSTATPAPR